MCTSSPPALAVVYCDADTCYLCSACDEEVHQANRLAQRHVRRPVSSVESEQLSDSTDLLVPDISDHFLRTASSSDDSLLDAETKELGYTDFDEFEGVVFAKMPALTSADGDSTFFPAVASTSLKDFEADELGWTSTAPSDFEHVVPDIEALHLPFRAKKCGAKDTAFSEGLLEVDYEVPALAKHLPCSVTALASEETETVGSSEMTSSPLETSDEDSTSEDRQSSSKDVNDLSSTESAEQRRQIRKEALERFRTKRANRSFQKRIRYNCRKMLADSRPRVKGRFVRKADMALYRRYGADYTEHLNESVPNMSPAPNSFGVA